MNENVKRLLEREPDVKRVLEVNPVGDRFRYLIETHFATFPRFVIGITDAAFEHVRIEFRCGQEYSARRHWSILELQGAGL